MHRVVALGRPVARICAGADVLWIDGRELAAQHDATRAATIARKTLSLVLVRQIDASTELAVRTSVQARLED